MTFSQFAGMQPYDRSCEPRSLTAAGSVREIKDLEHLIFSGCPE
jgi:hypothetical protein